MSNLKMSADGRAKLRQREGAKTVAYQDSKGIWTIGVGHTAAAGAPFPREGMVISRAEVDQILSRDLCQYEGAVNSCVRVPLTQGQFDALVSFCFNIGIEGFERSTVVKLLNKRDYRGAANAFMMWVKPPEIRGRREGERQQFVRATYAQVATKNRELTESDLRQSGSRTISGSDQVKNGVIGGAVSAGGAAITAASNVDPSEVISKVSDVAEKAKSINAAALSASGVLYQVREHWEWAVIAILACACLYFMWQAWRGASKVARARVYDANFAFSEVESQEE